MQDKKWDWKYAPEWATHVGECRGNLIWFNSSQYEYVGDKYPPYEWHNETLKYNLRKSDVLYFEPRPVQQESLWDGEGVPPNGTICMARAVGSDLHKAKVICQPMDDDQVDKVVAVVGLEGERKCLLWWTNLYQKITTKEEIEAEKEEKRQVGNIFNCLQVMQDFNGIPISNLEKTAHNLYKLGVRFPDKTN